MSKMPFTPAPQYTAIALAYTNRQLIAEQVLPRISVGQRSFKWDKHTKGDNFLVPDTKVGRKGRPNEVEFSATEQDASVEDFGLEDVVPNDDIAEARSKPGLDPLGRAVEGITNLLMLDREKRVADIVFSAATYPSGNKVQLSTNDQWNEYAQAASDPVADILTGKEGALMELNTCVMGEAVWYALRRHPVILKSVYPVNGSDKGMITLAQFAELFEFERVLVGRAKIASSKKGQSLTLVDVWGNHFAMHHQNPLASLRGNGITFGATAEWGSRLAWTRDEPDIGLRGAQRARVGETVVELITAADCGYFIEDAI